VRAAVSVATRARGSSPGESLSHRRDRQAWDEAMAADLVDEHPEAYKDIDQVMVDPADLVEVVHELRQVLNLEGTWVRNRGTHNCHDDRRYCHVVTWV
jgi:RNA-splicing ligase RtcB